MLPFSPKETSVPFIKTYDHRISVKEQSLGIAKSVELQTLLDGFKTAHVMVDTRLSTAKRFVRSEVPLNPGTCDGRVQKA